jgi:hypothetical protein
LQVHHLQRGIDLDGELGVAFAPARHARHQPAVGKGSQHGHAQTLGGAARGRSGGLHAVVELDWVERATLRLSDLRQWRGG